MKEIIFKNKKVYGKNYLIAGCDVSMALFELMSPKQHLDPKDLIHVAKMGFKFKILGDASTISDEFPGFNGMQ